MVNVALTPSEGLTRLVRDMLKDSLRRTVTAQVGALLSRKAFSTFKRKTDPSEYGGAPLLGVRGVCIVGHGSSNDRAIRNGIRVAAEFAQTGVNGLIQAELAQRKGPRLRPFALLRRLFRSYCWGVVCAEALASAAFCWSLAAFFSL